MEPMVWHVLLHLLAIVHAGVRSSKNCAGSQVSAKLKRRDCIDDFFGVRQGVVVTNDASGALFWDLKICEDVGKPPTGRSSAAVVQHLAQRGQGLVQRLA